MRNYWTIWLLIALGTFAVPEFVALARRRPQDTLSEWVWQHAQVVFHQPVTQWTATHFLFAIVFIGLAGWLVGHFVWGIWR